MENKTRPSAKLERIMGQFPSKPHPHSVSDALLLPDAGKGYYSCCLMTLDFDVNTATSSLIRPLVDAGKGFYFYWRMKLDFDVNTTSLFLNLSCHVTEGCWLRLLFLMDENGLRPHPLLSHAFLLVNAGKDCFC